MLDCDVAAALRAITAFADFAALKSAKEFLAFGDIDVLSLPQCERAYRRGRITTAILAMAITHLQRITAHLDLHRSAVTSTSMRLGHASTLTARFSTRRAKLTHPKSRDLKVVRPNLLKIALIACANGAGWRKEAL